MIYGERLSSTVVRQCSLGASIYLRDRARNEDVFRRRRHTDVGKLPVFKYKEILLFTELDELVCEIEIKILYNIDVRLDRREQPHAE